MISAGPPVCWSRRFSSLRPSGASWACPGESEKVMAVRASAATIRTLMVQPPRDRPIDWGHFFNAPVPSGCTSTMVLSSNTASSLMRTI